MIRSMRIMARYSSVSSNFLSITSFSNSIEPLACRSLQRLIFRPSWQTYLCKSSIWPLLETIIFETLFSGFFFASMSSGYKVSLIFRRARLYCSLTGISRNINIGWSSLTDLFRESPVGYITIEENGSITSWNIRLRSGTDAFFILSFISLLHRLPSRPGVVSRSLWNSDSLISSSDT